MSWKSMNREAASLSSVIVQENESKCARLIRAYPFATNVSGDLLDTKNPLQTRTSKIR